MRKKKYFGYDNVSEKKNYFGYDTVSKKKKTKLIFWIRICII